VTSAKIENGGVTSAKIANGAVGSSQIANGAVGLSKTDGSFVGTVNANSPATVGRSGSTVTIGVRFGNAPQLAARGNHTHTVSDLYPTRGFEGANLTGFVNITRTTSTPSTQKIKKDIESYEPSDIKKLLNLEPKKFKYKRSKRGYHKELNKEWMHGYMVEDLVDLGFSEPVGYDKDGDADKLDYGLMSLLVLELVKVQQTEIDFLKEEVTRLKDKK